MSQATKIDRRKALTIVAAMPAAFAAVTTAASAETDPTLEAIEAHRIAVEKFDEISNEENRLEELLPDGAGADACVERREHISDPEWRRLHVNGRCFLHSPEDIDVYYDKVDEQVQRDYGMFKAKYERPAVAKAKAARKECHEEFRVRATKIAEIRARFAPQYDEVRDRCQEAMNAADLAMERVCQTTPTTVAGAAAMTVFIGNVMCSGMDLSELGARALTNLTASLAALSACRVDELRQRVARVD